LGSGKTNYLKATGFGFTIPASAIICGVSVSVKKRAVGINLLNWISDEAVRLVVGGTVTGNNIASGTHWSGTAASVNYGSASDTWGATLTPADVNSSNFGVAIAAKYTGVLGVLLTAEIDYITIQVSYNYTPVPLILGEYNTHISGNLVSNKWTMYEEEENGKINLLRSYDGKNWNNIETIGAHFHIGEHKYEFIDSLYSSGTYYYRLELIHATGRKTYSRMNTVNYKGESKLILYPNPATDFIKITNVLKDEQVNVFTIDGQRLRLPVNYENGMLQLTVKPLKSGTYFIAIGKKRFSLIKQ
jgi:hypothetical protein